MNINNQISNYQMKKTIALNKRPGKGNKNVKKAKKLIKRITSKGLVVIPASIMKLIKATKM